MGEVEGAVVGEGALDAGRLDHLEARVLELERTVRFLRHRVELSDGAGRPAFKRPDFVEVGEGSNIGRGVLMTASEGRAIRIGSRSRILRGTEILGPVDIGNRVFINRDGYVRSQVTIGDGCSIGPFVRMITDSHEVGTSDHRAGAGIVHPITVGRGVWIGAGVTILGGAKVGDGAIIAAGAVVTADVEANTVVGGIPAKIIRRLE